MSKQGFGLSRAGLKQLSHHKTEWINEATKALSLTLWSLAAEGTSTLHCHCKALFICQHSHCWEILVVKFLNKPSSLKTSEKGGFQILKFYQEAIFSKTSFWKLTPSSKTSVALLKTKQPFFSRFLFLKLLNKNSLFLKYLQFKIECFCLMKQLYK